MSNSTSPHCPVPLSRLEGTGQKGSRGHVVCPNLVKLETPVHFLFLRNHPQLPAPPQVVLPVFIFCVFLQTSDFISQQICAESWPRLKLQGPFPVLQTSLESLTPRGCGQRANTAWTLSAGAQGSSASPALLSGWDTRTPFQSLQRVRHRSRVIQELQGEAVAVPNIHIQLGTRCLQPFPFSSPSCSSQPGSLEHRESPLCPAVPAGVV